LRKRTIRHVLVGAEEPANYGVVETSVHVYDLEVGVVLVAGEASVGDILFLYFLLDQKVAKSQVGRNPTAQPRPHRLPTLPPASVILKILFKF